MHAPICKKTDRLPFFERRERKEEKRRERRREERRRKQQYNAHSLFYYL
jgi:hypothetical protein